MFSQDIISMIMDQFDESADLLSARLINRTFAQTFYDMIRHHRSDHVYTCRTFIEINRCMICNHLKNVRCFTYVRDEYPYRQLLFCSSAQCVLTAINKYITDANQEKIYPFVQILKRHLWIPRTNGGFSPGIINYNSPLIEGRNKNINVLTTFSKRICAEISDDILEKNKQFELMKKIPIHLCRQHIKIDHMFDELFLTRPDAPLSL